MAREDNDLTSIQKKVVESQLPFTDLSMNETFLAD